jgi:FkbH-like protein
MPPEPGIPTEQAQPVAFAASGTRYHVVRNYTVEPFFAGLSCSFGAYGDVSPPHAAADACVFFYCVPILVEASRAAEEVRSYMDALRLVRRALPVEQPLVILTLMPIRNFGWVETDLSLAHAVQAFNALAHELAASHPNTHCLGLDGFAASLMDGPLSATPLFDWRFYYTHQTPLNPHLAGAFAAWFTERLEKLAFRRKKLLVLDLDGVLWDGVLGEGDALVGGAYPGNAFMDLQRMVAAIKDTGTVLAILSKNNLADVETFFADHPELPLRLTDFVAIACNWEPKPANLAAMLADLGLGPESVVVLDDSPHEREHLRRAFPQVTVPDLPPEPHALVPAVAQVLREHFSVHALTAEDRDKTRQYRRKREVEALRADLGLEAYLQSLDTRIAVARLGPATRSRFLQLTQKTNQFNLTTLRLTEADLHARERRGEQAYVLSVADRFGSHGVTGGALVAFSEDGAQARLEAFLLSCRVLGRGIEGAFLADLLRRLARQGVQTLSASFVPTAKNAVAGTFLETFGFSVQREEGGGLTGCWQAERPLPNCAHITTEGGCDD